MRRAVRSRHTRRTPGAAGALTLLLALAFAGPAGAQEPEAESTVSPVAFWRSLGDPTLESLIELALDANHDLRAAEARVRESRASRSEAVLDLVPRITASAGYSRQRLASASFPGAASSSLPDQSVWDAGVRMSWELDVFGRLRSSLEGRSALVESARRDTDDLRILLAAEVARAYYDLRGAQERLVVARRNAENQRRTLGVTLDRLELGSGTALDSERAQAQLSSTLAAIPSLETEMAAAAHRIGVLLGRPPAAVAADLSVTAEPARLLPEVRVKDIESIVRRRPDVLSAERQVAAQDAFVGAARADYLPRLSIDAVAGYTGSELDGLVDSGSARYAIGPVVSWPLFDLGRVKTRVDQARAAESQAVARYEQTILLALEEAETALAAYRNARERLRHLGEAAAASERATELARLRFEEGGTGFLEVLDAERRQLEAQDLLAAGRTEATAWLVAAYRALGGRVDAGAR